MIYKTFLKKSTYLFIAMILFFTFFSKTINNLNTPRIKTVKPREGHLVKIIRGQGQIKPEVCTRLYLPTTLIIDRVLVNPGDKIEEGTELFQLNSTMINNTYEQEYIKYHKTKLELDQLKEELQSKEIILYNIRELEKQLKFVTEDKNTKMMMYDSGSISKRALDEADIVLEQIQSKYLQSLNREETDKQNEATRIRNVQRRISTLEMELKVLKRKVDILTDLKSQSVFRSTIEGEILTIYCEEGEKISREDPVLSMINSSNNSYIFEAETDLDQIKDASPGDYASIYLNGDKEIESRLESIYSNNNGSTATLTFSVNDDSLTGNETGYFILRKRSGFYNFIVPKRSIRGTGREKFIYHAVEKQGALSKSYIIKKIRIKVLESSDTSVAVSGEIISDSAVVLDEDRIPLNENDRVLIE
ncbi:MULTISPECIES: HlyD family secretion protein [unclassified Oceanispirochaeta]|uniref:HlyD family secretion protein n=1 Tax=unclassified Oceanispirochaeta TaxID=2635722 RepID=UPI000E098368|nr:MULTISPECIES: efflux RND transporter periplasmic adaptor subunit [unclassified Oceanispirochaeta]MBF9015666.1 efflux RND transporter periplasmic adaptor subunit [Oceanispirochaeta sp. M2]NPD73440.1 efflux RND transporter periplasmic adaptor subunit [Oceanispirochaeta sp. M1]RDG30913.1 efflux RND transporter periplasmic adaptor subunit [Oceanispirochaeta sp. M1]